MVPYMSFLSQPICVILDGFKLKLKRPSSSDVDVDDLALWATFVEVLTKSLMFDEIGTLLIHPPTCDLI